MTLGTQATQYIQHRKGARRTGRTKEVTLRGNDIRQQQKLKWKQESIQSKGLTATNRSNERFRADVWKIHSTHCDAILVEWVISFWCLQKPSRWIWGHIRLSSVNYFSLSVPDCPLIQSQYKYWSVGIFHGIDVYSFLDCVCMCVCAFSPREENASDPLTIQFKSLWYSNICFTSMDLLPSCVSTITRITISVFNGLLYLFSLKWRNKNNKSISLCVCVLFFPFVLFE